MKKLIICASLLAICISAFSPIQALAQDEAPVPGQTQPSVYTVQWGDTLTGIAAKFDVPLAILQEANKVANPNFILVGETLVIPAWPTTTATADTTGKELIVDLNQESVCAFDQNKAVKCMPLPAAKYPSVSGHYQVNSMSLSFPVLTPRQYSETQDYSVCFMPQKDAWCFHSTSVYYNNWGWRWWHHRNQYLNPYAGLNLSASDAKWIFDWATVGTKVWIK